MIDAYVKCQGKFFNLVLNVSSPDDLEKLTSGNTDFKLIISHRDLIGFLKLPLSEFKKWVEKVKECRLSWGNFWYLVKRFEGKYENPDPEAYEKAEFILNELIKNKVKHEEPINVNNASYNPKTVQLIKKGIANILTETAISNIPSVKPNSWRQSEITTEWNNWLDKRRDPNKVNYSWGDLEPPKSEINDYDDEPEKKKHSKKEESKKEESKKEESKKWSEDDETQPRKWTTVVRGKPKKRETEKNTD